MATDITNVNQIKAAPVLTSGKMVKAGTNGIPSDATNTDTQVADAVTKAHVRSHSITSTSDHTSSATPTRVLIADANGLPVSGTNTNTEIASAVSNTHSRSHAIDSTSDHSVGSLTTNYLLKNDGSKVVNSLVFDNGNSVGIGTATPTSEIKLDVVCNKAGVYASRIANIETGESHVLLLEGMSNTDLEDTVIQMWKNNGVELATLTADGIFKVETLHVQDISGGYGFNVSSSGNNIFSIQDSEGYAIYNGIRFDFKKNQYGYGPTVGINDNGNIDFESTNITHGCTSVLPTNVHGRISNLGYDAPDYYGGLKLTGIGQNVEGGGNGLYLYGIGDLVEGIVLDSAKINELSPTNPTAIASDEFSVTFRNNGTDIINFYGDGDIRLGNTIIVAGGSVAGGANSYIKCGDNSSGYGGNKLNIVTPDCSFDTANNWIAPDISLQCGKNTYPNPDLYGNILLNANGGNVGIGINLPTSLLDVNGTIKSRSSTDGATLLTFSTDRPWSFKQAGIGSNTMLALEPATSDKKFVIRSPNATEAMTVFVSNTAGSNIVYVADKFGVGVINPIYKAEISHITSNDGSDAKALKITATAGGAGSAKTYGLLINASGSDDANYALLVENGYSGFGTTTPSEIMHVVGNIRNSALAGTGNRAVYSDASGNLTNSNSDATLKTNIETLSYGINDVIKLRPVKYNWREDLQSVTKEVEVEQIDNETGEKIKAKEYITEVRKGSQKEIGLIAQEVQNVIPEVIGTNSDGTLSVDYPKLVSVLIRALQDLKKEIDALKKR